MKKNSVDNINRVTWSAFLTSSVQYIICASITSFYLTFLSRLMNNASLGVIMIYLIFPIFSVLSAYGCYLLVSRRKFGEGTQNEASKATVYRLSARLMSVFSFLLIGVIMGVRGVMPGSIPHFIMFGESIGIIEPHLLINIFFYLLVAIFPTAYALFEYRFVTISNCREKRG